jgi:hypothetical protein
LRFELFSFAETEFYLHSRHERLEGIREFNSAPTDVTDSGLGVDLPCVVGVVKLNDKRLDRASIVFLECCRS